jgi:hypothetical protein
MQSRKGFGGAAESRQEAAGHSSECHGTQHSLQSLMHRKPAAMYSILKKSRHAVPLSLAERTSAFLGKNPCECPIFLSVISR